MQDPGNFLEECGRSAQYAAVVERIPVRTHAALILSAVVAEQRAAGSTAASGAYRSVGAFPAFVRKLLELPEPGAPVTIPEDGPDILIVYASERYI